MKSEKRARRKELWATLALIGGIYLISMEAEPWWFGATLRLAGAVWVAVAVRWLVRG